MRSDQGRNTRYSQGGKSTVNGNAIGWWERKIYNKSVMDVSLTITKRYAHRPDIVAYEMYENAGLAWFVLQYNNITDLIEDFSEGSVIVLPTKSRLFGDLFGRSPNF